MVSYDKTNNQLQKLETACKQYHIKNNNNSLAIYAVWIAYAVSWYIMTGRADVQFEENFCKYPINNFNILIDKCLKGDLSDEGIIKSVKRVII